MYENIAEIVMLKGIIYRIFVYSLCKNVSKKGFKSSLSKVYPP